MTDAALIQDLRKVLNNLQPDQIVDARQLEGYLATWEANSRANFAHQQAVTAEKDRALDEHLKVIALMIEKGTAYTNLVVIAGYASFFALLPAVRDLLTLPERRWSALLLVLSAGVFVGLEIFKMVFAQFSIIRRYDKFNGRASLPGFDLQGETKALATDLKKIQVRFIPVTVLLTTVSVLTGLAAVLILASAFALGIMNG